MNNKTREGKKISRRGILPIVGSMLFVPFLGFSKSTKNDITSTEEAEEEYQTLLKPDGTAVKVKVSTLNKSKVLKKNVSNKSLLNWLGRKL